MDTLDAIFARRDVRQYLDRPIAREDLERILEAGRRASFSINRQRWDFVAVTDRSRLTQLAKVWEEHTSSGAHRSRSTAFPAWVPREVMSEASALSTSEAERILSACDLQANERM